MNRESVLELLVHPAHIVVVDMRRRHRIGCAAHALHTGKRGCSLRGVRPEPASDATDAQEQLVVVIQKQGQFRVHSLQQVIGCGAASQRVIGHGHRQAHAGGWRRQALGQRQVSPDDGDAHRQVLRVN